MLQEPHDATDQQQHAQYDQRRTEVALRPALQDHAGLSALSLGRRADALDGARAVPRLSHSRSSVIFMIGARVAPDSHGGSVRHNRRHDRKRTLVALGRGL
jgi:hypothetical protein